MPKIVSINERSPAGTSLIDGVCVSYSTLVAKLGEPVEGGYKTDAEWVIEFEGGSIVTIYNWKDGKNYCGVAGLPVNDITDWHIGGYYNHREGVCGTYGANGDWAASKRVVRYLKNYLFSDWPPAFEEIRQEAEY
jgi:hypothetical protein